MHDMLQSQTLVVAIVVVVGLLVAGIVERRGHRARLSLIPLRVSVNGSRGKSTVTRLLTGALAATGRRTLGKTTGTEARVVLGWSGEELAVHRRPEGPNIGEQRLVMRRAAAEEADTVVSECMAVKPDYQVVFNRDLVDANVLVITNALDDHLDEMGPTSADVAEVFADSIPPGGVVVTVPGPHLDVFAERAHALDATLLVADPDESSVVDLVRDFDHLVFPEHVALTLACTRHLGVRDAVAVRGMLAAPPDPFATRLLPIGDPASPALFVNAFPANDPASTLGVWDHVRSLGHPSEDLVVVMNCRDDRVDRTHLFARDVLPALPIDTLVVTGAATEAVVRAAERGDIPVRRLHDLTGEGHRVLEVLDDPLRDRVVLGVGNLHGGGADVIDALTSIAVRDAGPDRPTATPPAMLGGAPGDGGADGGGGAGFARFLPQRAR